MDDEDEGDADDEVCSVDDEEVSDVDDEDEGKGEVKRRENVCLAFFFYLFIIYLFFCSEDIGLG